MTGPARGVPFGALLLLAAISASVALLTRFSAALPATPLLDPGLVAAALFLYTPLPHYLKGPRPAWVGPGRPARGAALFLLLLAGGAAAFALYLALPLPAALKPPAGELPPLGRMLPWQALVVALPEEVFFRGYLYDVFEERGIAPIIPTSVLFAAVHVAIHPSGFRALTVFPALLLGWGRKAAGNIYVPWALHLAFNLHPYVFGSSP